MAAPTPEEILRNDLALIDAAFATENAALQNAIEASQAAIATAGNEYDAEIAAAQATLAPAIATFNAHSATAKSEQVAAQSAAEAVTPVDSAALIDAIPDVGSVGLVDVELATIQAAFDAIVGDINTTIAAIKSALSAQNTPENIENLKSACTSLSNSNNSIIANVMPTVTDPQAEIDEALALIENSR